MNLNKGISTPVAILIIILCAALVGVVIWQYKGIKEAKELPPEEELAIPNAPNLTLLEGATPFVQISWNREIADYFNVYRATSSEGSWTKIIEQFPNDAGSAVDRNYPKDAETLYYRITSLDKEGNESSPSEISSIEVSKETPYIKLISPNGGEKWKQGQSYTVEWNGGSGKIGIKLIDKEGNSSGWINPSREYGSPNGSIEWNPSYFYVHGSTPMKRSLLAGKYKIKVGVLNEDPSSYCGPHGFQYPCDFTISDLSDDYFEVISKSEIKTGEIRISDAEVAELQEAVDNGHQPWRLDPLMVAKAEATEYGFSENDSFSLKEDYGRIAEVEATHKGKVYIITLMKSTQGEPEIWLMRRIEAQD